MPKQTQKKSFGKEEGGSQLQLAAIVEASHDAIIGKTLDGVVTSWNGGAENMYGYSAEEVIGKSALFLFPTERKDEMTVLLKKAKEGKVVADYDSVRLCKDGSTIDVALSISPVHSSNNKVVGISVVERDITERKRNEAHAQRITQLYAALSRCNKAVVHCENEAELFQEICSAAVELGGMTTAWVGLIDETTKQVKPVSSFGTGIKYLDSIRISVNSDDPFVRGLTGTSIRENRAVWCQDFQNDLATEPWHERAKEFGWRSSASLPLLKNETPIGSFSLYSTVINAFDDEARKLLTEMASDISFALSNLVRERKIKELNEVRSKFVEIVSHQLRTPLTAVNWNLESLLNGDFGKLEETQRKFLLATHTASLEITHRIHNLLVAMDVEEGRVRFIKEEVRLNNLCAAVVNELLKKAELKNILITYTPPKDDLPIIQGDGEKIRLAASILVENAVGYTKDGGKIKISLRAKDGVARFEVIDTGVGIPQPEQHLIFTRFFRASNSSVMQPDAFGLGLFIAKNFIEQHHGRIGFDSTEAKGSTFWFEIPLKSIN